MLASDIPLRPRVVRVVRHPGVVALALYVVIQTVAIVAFLAVTEPGRALVVELLIRAGC